MQQPVKDLLIAGGRWTEALDRHHAMEGTFWTWGLKSAFHFLELSFPKVDLFYFYFYFWFVSFPFQSQCRVTASFHGFGVAGGGMRNRPGMCLLLGTAESRVVCPLLFFFLTWSQELVLPKDDCNHLSDWGCIFKLYQPFMLWGATSTSAHGGGNYRLSFCDFLFFFPASLWGQIPFSKEGVLVWKPLE